MNTKRVKELVEDVPASAALGVSVPVLPLRGKPG
jgi:hypothetical protein